MRLGSSLLLGERLAFYGNADDRKDSIFVLHKDGTWNLELWDGRCSWTYIYSKEQLTTTRVLAVEAALPAIVTLLAERWPHIEDRLRFFIEVGNNKD